MKVLYIVSTLKRCGPTRQLRNLVKYLHRERLSPSILTLSPEPKDSMLPQFQKMGVPIGSLGLSRIKGIVFGPKAVKRYIADRKPEIIHSQGIRADMFSAKYFEGMNRVATLRNLPYNDYPMKFGKLRGTYMMWRHVNTLKQIDNRITCSHAVANSMYTRYGIKFQVIHNGVDAMSFSIPSPKERIQIRRKLGILLDARIFVCVGALIERKNPVAVVRAFLNSGVHKDDSLLMIGDGPLRTECERIAKGNPCIRFTGQVSNVREYLQAADFFISASISEGLPNAVLEALSVGLPVCLSNIGPHSEILNFNKKAGVIVAVGDINALTNGINELIKMNHENMSKAAVGIVNNHLSAQKMAGKYQDMYEKLTQVPMISCIGK
ncbi:MAG: glycosyltransferase [Planctomycetes bacterium]|nr:glycosyltransferase [Planctomycetota bacterium]